MAESLGVETDGRDDLDIGRDVCDELVKTYTDRGFNRSTATIYAMIEIMDRGIGQLLAELEADSH